MRQTRSATRAMENTIGQDSELRASSFSSVQPTTHQQPARSSVVGGHSDHGELPPLEVTSVSAHTVRAPCSVSHASTRLSRASREALRMRVEYEAEVEMAKVKETLIKKKLALDMAELAAKEDEENNAPASVASGENSPRATSWLNDAPAGPRAFKRPAHHGTTWLPATPTRGPQEEQKNASASVASGENSPRATSWLNDAPAGPRASKRPAPGVHTWLPATRALEPTSSQPPPQASPNRQFQTI
ncbi:unnamed protein product [Arctia plantaginis]|uniref:Uncharacterized protein n=1 Tax=Arctia plantaginis TaxID=874455 RepID=A0A8S1AAZ0_ARCPL|nr:unnamed protein product [Arctia plantaginis]